MACTTRGSRERPRSSVPNGRMTVGLDRRGPTWIRLGSPIGNQGPAIPSKIRQDSRTTPNAESGSFLAYRQARAIARGRLLAKRLSPRADARIEKGVDHIGQHVEGYEEHRREKDARLHHGV